MKRSLASSWPTCTAARRRDRVPDGATLTSSDNLTWTLGNLASLTDPTQHWDSYTLTLTAAGSGITGPASNPLTNNASTAFTVLYPALSLLGSTLTVAGTSGNDTFTFVAGTPDVFTLNGAATMSIRP